MAVLCVKDVDKVVVDNLTKTCCICKVEKSVYLFCKNRYKKYGYNTRCKDCTKQINKLNVDKIRKQRKIAYDKNKKQILLDKKQYYLNNRIKIIQKNYKYKAIRYRNDINFKLICNLRRRLIAILNDNVKCDTTINIIGCDINYLKTHIEKQFKNGMTWDNYGKVWHVDHIIPLSFFDMSDITEQKISFHWGNLQPLYVKDNLEKGNIILSKNFIY